MEKDSVVSDATPFVGNWDHIFRIQKDSSSVNITILGQTKKFAKDIFYPCLESVVLKEAIKNLWNAYQYNQEYISYLLKTTTKEEFLQKARAFSTSFQKISNEQLALGANVLLEVLDQPLSSSDFSLFFNVDPNQIENNDLRLLEYNPEEDNE